MSNDVPFSRSTSKDPSKFGNPTVESTSKVVAPETISDTTFVFG